jgi:hypothetical protein
MPAQGKKLLALDGGGIRGVLTLGILAEIEKAVKQPLGEYFDYIAGTSTGAIIAAGLAHGLSVAELQEFYVQFGPSMFEKRFVLKRLHGLYKRDPLVARLREIFRPETTLGARSSPLLLIVTRNWTTDSPWPVSSNPSAIYNDPGRADCNLKIPLWQLVRASTAAPVYFPPEVLQWDPGDESRRFVFVDGGVTPYNNPAFLLYRMATLPEYRLGWETGESKLLLVSVGTGSAPRPGPAWHSPEPRITAHLPGLISALTYAAEIDQDVNCRTVGRCTFGNIIDDELGDMVPRDYDGGCCPHWSERSKYPVIPLSRDLGRAFLYARYNPILTAEELRALGVRGFRLNDLLRMDLATPQNIRSLADVGRAAGSQVRAEHFGPFAEIR